MIHTQWIRKISLTLLSKNGAGLDLSKFHIRFNVRNADIETPNTAVIRVYNLAKQTVDLIKSGGEYSSVTLQAGYEGDGNFGVIFTGDLRQFRVGRENATDSYLDILASDGDIFYNEAFLNESIESGLTQLQVLQRYADKTGMPLEPTALTSDSQHFVIPRGSVAFGMARSRFRDMASNLDASWSVQDGIIVYHNNTGYVGNESVILTAATGLVGVPEQTNEGISVKCLLNSRIRIGGLVSINNNDINQISQSDPNAASISYDSWKNIQQNAALSGTGTYQAFVVEHEGDTRGQAWYTDLVCLSTDLSNSVAPVKGGF